MVIPSSEVAMRYFSLLLLVPSLLGLTLPQLAAAQTNGEPSEVRRSQSFWPGAEELVQEQIFLVNRIEQAVSGPDPNLVRATQGQITLHTTAVERFLQSQYPLPRLLCRPGAGPSGSPNLPGVTTPNTDELAAVRDNLEQAQTQIYCDLYRSTQRLLPLRAVLDRRLYMLASVAEVKPLPLVSGETQPNPLPTGEIVRPDLGKPAKPLYGSVPDLPAEVTPTVGQPMKTAIADYDPPDQPAIAPPEDVLLTLRSIRQQLAQTQALFPRASTFVNPQPVDQARDRNAYGLYPQESQLYAKFLAQPNTGIARILLAEVHQSQLNTLQNRLDPTVAERFPFDALTQRRDGFTPQLKLAINQNNFQLVQPGLDYGFIVPIGDVPLENLDASLDATTPAIAPEIRQLLFNYQPPQQLAALQTDRRRFMAGKTTEIGLGQAVSSQISAGLNQTYLLRSLQFDLPEAILTGRPISRSDRRYLDQLLDIESSDLLIAVRPVRRHTDGSYTVLWRVIRQFPNPEIRDLDQYVNFD